MKPNIYWLGALLAVVLCGSACKKDFLDEHYQSGYSAGNTYTDSLGAEAGVTGLYALAREQYGSMVTNYTYGFGMIPAMNSGTDIAMMGNYYASQVPYSTYGQLTSQDPISSGIWQWGYAMVNNANLLISSLSGNAGSFSDSYRRRALSEALFFRAYAYNFLTTMYGDVPLLTTPLSTPKTDFTRAKEADVLNQVVQDLSYAVKNLPGAHAVTAEGRIPYAAAAQELAQVYLKLNKPDSAALLCQQIISSGDFHLVQQRYGSQQTAPGDAFHDMFIQGNMDYQQGNTEAIWVIQEVFNVIGGTSNVDEYRRAWVPYYANVSGMLICDSLGGRGLGRIRPTNWVTYGLYESNDMRNSAYNFRRQYYYNDPTYSKNGQRVSVSGSDTLGKIYATTTKWNSYYALDPTGLLTSKDRIMMRLGETYLLLAEAQVMQGNLADAAASVNVIRTRANASPVTAAQMSLDFVLDERVRELIGEENRRETLMRTKTLVQRVKKYNAESAASIQDFNALLPVPQSDIDLNKDAKLVQNTGY